METAGNKYITVAYELYTTEDGEKDLVEKATIERPFQFITGLGTTLETFESQVKDLNIGDKFEFTIPLADAYGEYDEEHVLDLPRQIFEIDGKFDTERIYDGSVVPLMDSEGHRLNGTVVEVKAETVVMDMNHPLAGADLTFIGEVIENRAATNAEIEGMVNMMSGEEEGGCGCGGSCGDGGCNCSEEKEEGEACACGGDCGCGGHNH
ncbi:FKBP-type peptidyl-prolyl cis-trans isomerase [uncultured Bacteroides sp.]|uniref:FKBP-type peptidyl-prolyl cis-trans isomerase n=1 Tax=uncultured Bacteroides sp. TaxID=162156 RepID=UPI002AA62022|nr:FKBP-type peptidyl-prolyl cis-trans isomerase [uncultured Bacteroides sp.]